MSQLLTVIFENETQLYFWLELLTNLSLIVVDGLDLMAAIDWITRS
jgi:hypothetical protein